MAKRGYRLYEPLLPKSKEWPVVLLARQRSEFIAEVTEDSYEKTLSTYPDKASLREEIETTLFREKQRIKRNPWKVDPPDEKSFWEGIQKRLVESSADPGQEQEKEMLRKIISRYANEIAGNFKRSRYRMARSLITAGFRRLLNAAKLRTFKGTFRGKHTLKDNIKITGEMEKVRSLATKGTIVMVPTHFSNLDSVLIGWVIHQMGLPPFIYGAGLNLFNIGVFAYFMNSLGAYKVDRRKKNFIYLETLKTYSTLAIQRGCHSLFFPGGTRSRSGKIEDKLKMGLLGTALEAQRKAYQDAEINGSTEVQKVYIVPVVLNYNFVLEAPVLIRQYLERMGQERYYIELDEYSTSYKIVSFLIKFFTKDSKISVSIGSALDLLGNPVDNEGRSLDKSGNIIDTREYFMTNGKVTADTQREQEYTRMLSEVIVSEFHRINRVFSGHLVAFVCFQMFKKKYSKLDLYNLFRISEDALEIPYEDFREVFIRVRDQVLKLHKEGKVDVASHMSEDPDTAIQIGLDNVGMYQVKRPVIRNKVGNIVSQDLHTLYYYHNRMDGYDLEKYI
jgi:glycerol-3-phosphate O-acyltransferase